MKLFRTSKLPAFIDRKTKAVAATFNLYWEHFDTRLHSLEELKVTWQAATADLMANGLTRIDSVLRPAIELVANVSAFGLLAFEFSYEFEIEIGEQTLVVPIDKRATFTALKVMQLGRTTPGVETEFAVCRLVSYDRETGELVINVVAMTEGLEGEAFSDWCISAGSAVMPTIANLASQVFTHKVAAAASAVAAAASAAAAALFDPSNYYPKGTIDGLLLAKSDSDHTHGDLETAIAAKADGTATTAALASKADGTATTSALAGKAAIVPWNYPSADVNPMVVGNAYLFDSSGGARIGTLPVNAADGDRIIVGRNGANTVTVARNTRTIGGATQDAVLNINKIKVAFVRLGTNWIIVDAGRLVK